MTYQSNAKDCGKACLRNALTIIYKDETYQWLYTENKDDDFLSLLEDFKKEGVEYKGYAASFSNLKTIEKNKYPLLVQVKNGDVLHFVLVTKITKKKVIIFDPEFGRCVLDHSEFESSYLGKVLVKESVKGNPKKPKADILNLKERIFYISLFFMECLSFTFFFYSISLNLHSSILIWLVLSVTIVMLHVFYNSYLMNELHSRVLFPYLDCYKNAKDFEYLSGFIKETISRYSTLISTAFCVFEIMVLFLSNGMFSTILGIVAVSYGLILYKVKQKYATVNRYCSIQERMMISSLQVSDKEELILKKNYKVHYQNSKKKADEFHVQTLLSYILLLFLLSVFIFIDMKAEGKFSLNYFLFYVSAGSSVSFFTEKTLHTFFFDGKRIQCLNSLSHDLSFFLLKNKSSLRYTNKENFGGLVHGRKTESYSRLSRQNRTKEIV